MAGNVAIDSLFGLVALPWEFLRCADKGEFLERVTQLGVTAACDVMFMRDRFERREPDGSVPRSMWPLVALHAAVCLSIVLYPLLVVRRYDGLYFLALGAVLMHWVFLRGECLLGWLEKRTFYRAYRMGDAPAHMWWVDVMPTRAALLLTFGCVAAWYVAVAAVIWRNVRLEAHGVALELRYGGLGDIRMATTFSGPAFEYCKKVIESCQPP
jgi:hypothetical protein